MTFSTSLPSTSMATRAQTFPKFGCLPPELRIRIWQEAMPDARTIVVKSPHARQDPKSLDECLARAQDPETWHSNAQIPALLHVNAEARHEALKHYSLALACGNAQPRIFVDFTRDTFFFGNTELKQECSRLWATTHDLDKVQRLAVVPEGAWRVLRWKKVNLNALRKIIFVHDTDDKQLGRLPELIEDTPQEEIKEIAERIEGLAEETEETQHKEMPIKQRMEAAREELDTLMMVLPTQWEKEPAVSTAVFRKYSGDDSANQTGLGAKRSSMIASYPDTAERRNQQ